MLPGYNLFGEDRTASGIINQRRKGGETEIRDLGTQVKLNKKINVKYLFLW